MSGAAGLVALDPVRMRGLEAYLQGLGDACRHRGARVEADVAATGAAVSVAAEVAELSRLAVECQRLHDDVAHRRALVEQMEETVPLPSWIALGAAPARAAAEALALRVGRLVDSDTASWPLVAGALGELERLGASEELAARFLTVLGARRARELHALIPPASSAERLVQETVRLGTRHEGADALGERWVEDFLGVSGSAPDGAPPHDAEVRDAVRRGLDAAGYGATFAALVASAVGANEVAVGLKVAGGAAKGATVLTDGDGFECDGPEALFGASRRATSVAATAVGPSPAGVVLRITSAGLRGLELLFGACTRQPPRMRETTPTFDPEAGETRLPSGHLSNPHVDGSGVPFPPSYG